MCPRSMFIVLAEQVEQDKEASQLHSVMRMRASIFEVSRNQFDKVYQLMRSTHSIPPEPNRRRAIKHPKRSKIKVAPAALV